MSAPSGLPHEPRRVRIILQRALSQVEREQRALRTRVVRSTNGGLSAEVSAKSDEALSSASNAAVALRTTSAATSGMDMPTVAVPLGAISAGGLASEIDTEGAADASVPEHHEVPRAGVLRRIGQRLTVSVFDVWIKSATAVAKQLRWFPSVKPYVGYGTKEYSRLVCRTIYAPKHAKPHTPMRGIHAMLEVPVANEPVRIEIDGVPVQTVQVGTMEVYDRNDPSREQTSEYCVSDESGYLDLLAEHHLQPGVHSFSCKVANREPVETELFTIPCDAPVGVISDVDDTIMVTQVPTLWKAAYNMLFLSPHKRASVPGMAVMYNDIHTMFPDAPFFYLSTSPWNVESSIRKFINDYDFPDGPLLLRDLAPRKDTFITSGVRHKLEYAEQLMEDFPHMKFILLGDDGQKDPTTYAEIARRYPGRVLAIGIRQLSPRESAGGLGTIAGLAATQPMPETDVPVFTGTTGANIRKTMLPYLQQFASGQQAS